LQSLRVPAGREKRRGVRLNVVTKPLDTKEDVS
jgi:hypothetical protein